MKVGDVIDGKYEILGLIGQGGMGAVYEARHTLIKRRYALKILHAQYAENENIAQRFILEAQAAAAIGSEHIIESTDAGKTDDGCPYLVMELLEGEDLAAVLAREGPLAPARAAALLAQACDALAAAHRAGIVHRDLKPGNLFIARRPDGEEWVKVLDFGIAKFKDLSLTPTQLVLGTLFYMSPEQAEVAKQVDARADIYSMGVILYETLTGHLPFDAGELRQVLAQVLMGNSIAPTKHRPDLPAELEKIVLRAMAREREDRYQSMEELGAALRPFAEAAADASNESTAPVGEAEESLPISSGFLRTRVERQEPPPSAPSTAALRAVHDRAVGRRRRLLAVAGVIALGMIAATVVVASGNLLSSPALARSVATSRISHKAKAAAPSTRSSPAASPATPTSRDVAGAADLNRWVHVTAARPGLLLGLSPDQVTSTSVGFHPDRGITAPTYNYEIQQHEVTWGELRPWIAAHAEALASAGWHPDPGGERSPAVGVPWELAHQYCQSIGGSLPTEEEWEYAARGAKARPYPWGSDAVDLERTHAYRPGSPLSRVMTSDQDATPGGAAQAIYDLLGNAQEWTSSLWREDAPGQPEGWVQSGGRSFRAVRGLPPAAAQPAALPAVGAAFREPLCATGDCPTGTAQDLAVVGFRCSRRAP